MVKAESGKCGKLPGESPGMAGGAPALLCAGTIRKVRAAQNTFRMDRRCHGRVIIMGSCAGDTRRRKISANRCAAGNFRLRQRTSSGVPPMIAERRTAAVADGARLNGEAVVRHVQPDKQRRAKAPVLRLRDDVPDQNKKSKAETKTWIGTGGRKSTIPLTPFLDSGKLMITFNCA